MTVEQPMDDLMPPYSEVIRKLDGDEWVYSNDTDFANPEKYGWERMYTDDQMREYAKKAVEAERARLQPFKPAIDNDPCPGCRKDGVCRTPKCGRLALPVDHPYRR